MWCVQSVRPRPRDPIAKWGMKAWFGFRSGPFNGVAFGIILFTSRHHG